MKPSSRPLKGFYFCLILLHLLTHLQVYAQGTVAKPVISPGSGQVVSGTNFLISCETPGATIYYTINGNTPVVGTTFTKVYAGPFGTNTNMTVKAIGVKNGMANSSMAIAVVEVIGTPPRVATPVISPGSGNFNSLQNVIISCSTPNATILYTTNGNVPLIGATFTKIYSGSFSVSSTTTVRAIAVANNFSNSEVAVAYLTFPSLALRVAKPIISPGSGTVTGPVNASITCATQGATIYYTISGNEPVPGTTFTKVYTGPILIHSNTTIRAMAMKTGMERSATAVSYLSVNNPTIVATPAISHGTATYSGNQTIILGCATPGATIYYTTSGNIPTIGTGFTRVYNGPIQISATTTIRAMAVKAGLTNSAVAVSYITIIPTGGRMAVQEEPESQASWSFSPNPSQGDITLQLSKILEEPCELLIFNTIGTEVKRLMLEPGFQKNSISLSELKSGIYFIRLGLPGNTQMERLIRN